MAVKLPPTSEKSPKRARFTFAERINGIALDLVEDLVDARYSKNKALILRSANFRLEKLRVLIRTPLALDVKYAKMWVNLHPM